MTDRNAAFLSDKPATPRLPDAERAFTNDKEKGLHQNVPQFNELEFAPDNELTFFNIIKGTAANELTAFERKAALINL